MSLSEFDITWSAAEGLTVRDEIECPNPDCGVYLRVEKGEAIYPREP